MLSNIDLEINKSNLEITSNKSNNNDKLWHKCINGIGYQSVVFAIVIFITIIE